jgi:hypothetical protein
MLNSEAAKDPHAPVVHTGRDAEMVFAYWHTQKLAGCLIQTESFRDAIELLPGSIEKIKRFIIHVFYPGCG